MDLERFANLKKQVEDAQREKDQLVGGRKELLARLEKEFGIKLPKEAKQFLAKLDQQIDTEGLRYERLISEAEEALEKEVIP